MKNELKVIEYDTAKLARVAGFEDHFFHRKGESSETRWRCEKCYDPEDENRTLQNWSDNSPSVCTEERLERLLNAPTQELLKKWFRDNYWICIEPYYWGGIYNVRIINTNNTVLLDTAINNDGDWLPSSKGWDEYEEALEEGLKMGLNLILK